MNCKLAFFRVAIALAVFTAASTSAGFAECPTTDLGVRPELFGTVRTSGTATENVHLSIEPADRRRPPENIIVKNDGTFRFAHLAPGHYRLIAHRKGLSDDHYTVQISPRASRKPVTLQLPLAGEC